MSAAAISVTRCPPTSTRISGWPISRKTKLRKWCTPSYPINNALPNSIASLTPFDDTYVVINQFPEDGGMRKGYSIVQQQNDSTWAYPSPITIEDYYNYASDVNMTMSGDGSVIVFSMVRGDAYGDADLYVSFRKSDTIWSAPVNLGPHVNSHRRETTPFLSDDLKTLYFSSNKRNPGGNRDIFFVYRKDDSWQKWSIPMVLKKPINSPADESHPYFNPASGYIYFSSDRNGNYDLFRVRIAPPNPILVTVKGRIINRATNKRTSGKVVFGPSDHTGATNTYVSDDGTFRMSIPKGKVYRLTARKVGFTGSSDSVFFKKQYVYYKEREITLYVDPIEVGMKVELPNIYFVQSEPVILERSFPALDELAQFLEDNPRVRIRVEGHTDNLGDKGGPATAVGRAGRRHQKIFDRGAANPPRPHRDHRLRRHPPGE